MSLTAFEALVRRDLRLFVMDRRAVTMSLVAPIVIASFFGYLFGGVTSSSQARIPVAVVDQDQSTISKAIIRDLTTDQALEVREDSLEAARGSVRGGKTTVALIIPQGFLDQSARAFLRGGEKPQIALLYDPSHGAELAMVKGILTQHVMELVSREALSGASSQKYLDEAMAEAQRANSMDPRDRQVLLRMLEGVGGWNQRQREGRTTGGVTSGGLNMPYQVREEAVTARKGVPYNAMAHSFAGMSVQFILMMGVDAGLLMLMHKRSGIWKRLRAAPLSRFAIVGSRATSAAIIAVCILFIVFGFARVVFGVRVEGSLPGFIGVCVAFALMTAAFGLLVAVSGKTPEATRGLAILVTLILVMLGGAWVPAFIFPQWLQKATFAVPTRWAVDGLDAMTWRGLGIDAAVIPIAAMLGFAALFGALAVWRFRWDAE